MMIQGDRVILWLQWPAHHVKDTGSIALTAVHPGRKPSGKMVKLLTQSLKVTLNMTAWHMLACPELSVGFLAFLQKI